MLEFFDRTHSGNSILDRIQDKIMRVLNPALKMPILNGQLLEQVVITYTGSGLSNKIAHKLGRVPRGWIVCGVCSPPSAHLGDIVTDVAAADDKYLYLEAQTQTVVTNLWVF